MVSDSGKTQHKPGEMVQKPGIYSVTHQRHRRPHEVSFRADETFPTCTKCGKRVRFQLIFGTEGKESEKKIRG
jgi:hypothetical protein